MAWCEGVEAPRLLIAPVPPITNKGENIIGNANAEGCLLSLRHPQSGKPACYILREGYLQELHWFKQSYGSWFLGDYVCEDGSLYISTPIDPIFVLLPIFEEARMKKASDQGVFRQLDEILYVDGYPGYQHLFSVAKDTMNMVCELKEIGSSKFFRLDNSRVLAWLCCKVQHLKATLLELDKNYTAQEERETLKDVISIVGEYVKDEPWLALLCSHLKLDIEETRKETTKTMTGQIFLENNSEPCHTFQSKVENGGSMPSNRRQSKRPKTETNSQNIKDMFRRVTRKAMFSLNNSVQVVK
ncbi:Ydr279p protein family (RNase H2 complex component) [Musa troglodytarum]|uniref:Ribonuclease H2 subunit B n=1 Tax=Musa troglodytarum TaxID=320322 RepID=A0A9E7LDX7_9LILI|nr:Ydr279p protein family (RNase H2 complex component) [Musa troglodytarum]URE46926.1 Ydr279p protein family (RNase H2 complex component) [Musa troglodytarum]